MRHYLKPFCFWLVFLAVAVACGILRESWLIPSLGPGGGRAAGTLLLCVLILGLIYLYVRKLTGASRNSVLRLGIFWTVLTGAFEFLGGRYVMGATWESLLADYNVLRGRLWPLVLLTTLWGPWLALKMSRYVNGKQPA
jgi:hypothetical protein